MAENITNFHIYLTPSSGHAGVEIVVEKPSGGLLVFELPEPFGCLIGSLLVHAMAVAANIQKVPPLLRNQLTHEAAAKVLETAFDDLTDAAPHRTQN